MSLMPIDKNCTAQSGEVWLQCECSECAKKLAEAKPFVSVAPKAKPQVIAPGVGVTATGIILRVLE